MLRLKRHVLSSSSRPATLPSRIFPDEFHKPFLQQPSSLPSQRSSARFIDIHQFVNKSALEKERARLKDEMNRGYFADISEMKQHGGKIAMSNKTMIPAMVAVKFPSLEVNYSDGRALKLPFCFDASEPHGSTKPDIPKASLLCFSFRANSQAMVESWSVPFVSQFSDLTNVQLYEVSLIDSWFLTLSPVKRLLLRMMKKPNPNGTGLLQRQSVYAFGDNYYLRKELRIVNLLTGYIYLLDKFGMVRWQGFGSASEEELSSLFSCTRLLLED